MPGPHAITIRRDFDPIDDRGCVVEVKREFGIRRLPEVWQISAGLYPYTHLLYNKPTLLATLIFAIGLNFLILDDTC